VVSESAAQVTYVVYDTPFAVGLETAERCWVKVTVDGENVFEKTLEAGQSGRWTAKEELFLRLGRPHVVTVSLGSEVLGPAGTEDVPRNLVFRVGPAADGD